MDGKKRVWNKSGVHSVPNPLAVAAQCLSTQARFVVERTRYFADPGVREAIRLTTNIMTVQILTMYKGNLI